MKAVSVTVAVTCLLGNALAVPAPKPLENGSPDLSDLDLGSVSEQVDASASVEAPASPSSSPSADSTDIDKETASLLASLVGVDVEDVLDFVFGSGKRKRDLDSLSLGHLGTPAASKRSARLLNMKSESPSMVSGQDDDAVLAALADPEVDEILKTLLGTEQKAGTATGTDKRDVADSDLDTQALIVSLLKGGSSLQGTVKSSPAALDPLLALLAELDVNDIFGLLGKRDGSDSKDSKKPSGPAEIASELSEISEEDAKALLSAILGIDADEIVDLLGSDAGSVKDKRNDDDSNSHSKDKPSVSDLLPGVSDKDAEALLDLFAGLDLDDVLGALGLDKRGLMDSDPKDKPSDSDHQSDVVDEDADSLLTLLAGLDVDDVLDALFGSGKQDLATTNSKHTKATKRNDEDYGDLMEKVRRVIASNEGTGTSNSPVAGVKMKNVAAGESPNNGLSQLQALINAILNSQKTPAAPSAATTKTQTGAPNPAAGIASSATGTSGATIGGKPPSNSGGFDGFANPPGGFIVGPSPGGFIPGATSALRPPRN